MIATHCPINLSSIDRGRNLDFLMVRKTFSIEVNGCGVCNVLKCILTCIILYYYYIMLYYIVLYYINVF